MRYATDNDAAEPIYNRLVEFERGDTAVHPTLATWWRIPRSTSRSASRFPNSRSARLGAMIFPV